MPPGKTAKPSLHVAIALAGILTNLGQVAGGRTRDAGHSSQKCRAWRRHVCTTQLGLAGVLADIGHDDPDQTARAMMMVRTGALVGASLEVGVTDSSIGALLWNCLARKGLRGLTEGADGRVVPT